MSELIYYGPDPLPVYESKQAFRIEIYRQLLTATTDSMKQRLQMLILLITLNGAGFVTAFVESESGWVMLMIALGLLFINSVCWKYLVKINYRIISNEIRSKNLHQQMFEEDPIHDLGEKEIDIEIQERYGIKKPKDTTIELIGFIKYLFTWIWILVLAFGLYSAIKSYIEVKIDPPAEKSQSIEKLQKQQPKHIYVILKETGNNVVI